MDIFKLKSSGIDYDEGLNRFAFNAPLYQKFLIQFFSDTAYEKLKEYIGQKNYTEALACAHTLKGTAGNLSIKDFYEKIDVLVYDLRNNRTENLDSIMEELNDIYEIAKMAVK